MERKEEKATGLQKKVGLKAAVTRLDPSFLPSFFRLRSMLMKEARHVQWDEDRSRKSCMGAQGFKSCLEQGCMWKRMVSNTLGLDLEVYCFILIQIIKFVSRKMVLRRLLLPRDPNHQTD